MDEEPSVNIKTTPIINLLAGIMSSLVILYISFLWKEDNNQNNRVDQMSDKILELNQKMITLQKFRNDTEPAIRDIELDAARLRIYVETHCGPKVQN